MPSSQQLRRVERSFSSGNLSQDDYNLMVKSFAYSMRHMIQLTMQKNPFASPLHPRLLRRHSREEYHRIDVEKRKSLVKSTMVSNLRFISILRFKNMSQIVLITTRKTQMLAQLFFFDPPKPAKPIALIIDISSLSSGFSSR